MRSCSFVFRADACNISSITHRYSSTSWRVQRRTRLAQPGGAITRARGRRRSDGRSRWSWCACEIRITSTAPSRGSAAPATVLPGSYRTRTPVGSSKIIARSCAQNSPVRCPSGVTLMFWACTLPHAPMTIPNTKTSFGPIFIGWSFPRTKSS